MVGILRSYIVGVSIGIFLISCEGSRKKTPATEKSDKKIKTIMESIHDPVENAGTLENQSTLSEGSSMIKFAFAQQGALLAKSTFDSNGNLVGRITYKYTVAGDTLETATYSFSETLLSKWVNEFDSQHKLTKSKEIDASGKIIGKRIVERAGDDTLRVSTYGQLRGELVKLMESYLDGNNRSIRNSFFTNGKTICEVRIIYDDKENKIETDQFYPFKKARIITQYKFDQLNNNIEKIILNNNLMITSKMAMRYDEKNNIIEILTYGIAGRLEKRLHYTYQYDEFANWTKRVAFENNKPAEVTLHRIAYY